MHSPEDRQLLPEETPEKLKEVALGIRLRQFLEKYTVPQEKIGERGLHSGPCVMHSTTEKTGDFVELEEIFKRRTIGFLNYLQRTISRESKLIETIDETMTFFMVTVPRQINVRSFIHDMHVLQDECENALRTLGWEEGNEDAILEKIGNKVKSFGEILERRPDGIVGVGGQPAEAPRALITEISGGTAIKLLRALIEAVRSTTGLSAEQVQEAVVGEGELARLQRANRQLEVELQAETEALRRAESRAGSIEARNHELSRRIRELEQQLTESQRLLGEAEERAGRAEAIVKDHEPFQALIEAARGLRPK